MGGVACGSRRSEIGRARARVSTGCAAVNINGNTLTSLFSFPFDCKMASMAEKTRDLKRATFQDLKLVIVDEFSMVKNVHNELLSFRLGEIMDKRDLPYGGIAVFLFGDLCQLRPVKGKFIVHIF